MIRSDRFSRVCAALGGRAARFAGLLCAWSMIAVPAAAQTVSGTVFEDRNANGIHDPGEPVLSGVPIRLFGTADAGGGVDQSLTTDGGGNYQFSVNDGCYLLAPDDAPGWRLSQTREDGRPEGSAGYDFPVGLPRFSKLDHAIDRLQSGSYRYTAIGDSIAWNFNICFYPESFWYSKRFRERLACVAPGTTVSLDQGAIKGEHTDDLLVDQTGELNNVFSGARCGAGSDQPVDHRQRLTRGRPGVVGLPGADQHRRR